MSDTPIHWLNLYQKPKKGSSFITRKIAYKYRHQKIAVGGDDTMSCELAVTPKEGELALENWVGNRVAVFVDNPIMPIWEGIITRIYYNVGGLTVSRSLDDMFNAVAVYYNATGTAVTISTANELNSQAVYGIKYGTMEGFVSNGVQTNLLTALRNLVIAQVPWPLTSIAQSDQNSNLRIEAKGFYHTLKWDVYSTTGTAAVTISNHILNVLAGLTNATTFFDNSDTSLVTTNALSIQGYENFGKSAWQVLQKVQGAGDGTNFYVMGIGKTDPMTGKRRFYYRPSRTDVYYTARTADGLRVRNLYGGIVKPWAVEADRTIRVQDILTGWNGRGIDPRSTYIEAVRYDADKQEVTWSGADNLYMQGALQSQRYYKMHDTLFGAAVRNTWS